MNSGTCSGGVIICVALEGGWRGLLLSGVFLETVASFREKI